MNKIDTYNSNSEIKLNYELWLTDWKKRHCQQCFLNVPAPANCYLCYQERKIGFRCAVCSHFIYYSESQICGGNYNTGYCFCDNCQGLIKKTLESRNCACQFSLAGYSTGHPIHNYRSTIQGLSKPLLKGSKLWIKLLCRSCSKIIQTFKLNCSCYLEQKKHQHQYSEKKCLSCAAGFASSPGSEWELKKKYQDYCQVWQERKEIQAQISVKRQYKYDGQTYWAKCSFCHGWVQGKQKDKEPLSRNKVSFWTEKEIDERIICNNCLRENKKVLKSLNIQGNKRQMLYNYRVRRII